MAFLTDLLINYGYWGMLIAAMLAGSILPFSSEAVMLGLMAAGLDPVQLVVYGTIGNTIGAMLNYGLGRMGKMEWIERYMHVMQSDLDKASRFMAGHGAWMGFFSFLPVIGEAIMIVLGLMRANLLLTFVSVVIGKIVRYGLLGWGGSFFF